MNKWQTITNNYLSKEFLEKVGEYCDEFLIHAADVEGLCKGIDEELIKNYQIGVLLDLKVKLFMLVVLN